MTSNELSSADAIAVWLSDHLTVGEDMTRPYKRKFENGGCTPKFSLWSWPSDRVAALALGLASLEHRAFGIENGIVVETAAGFVRVSADRTFRNYGPPHDYLIQILDGPVNYVGNSPEVIVELLRGLPLLPSPAVGADILEFGFPGHERDEVTYVGSWQWDIHGEARGTEFIDRAAAATLAAIEAAGKD